MRTDNQSGRSICDTRWLFMLAVLRSTASANGQCDAGLLAVCARKHWQFKV